MNKPFKELEEILKYNFKDKILLERGVPHKRVNNQEINENLEFVGG